MSLALTVFGVAAQGSNSVFCYAFLRDVRGTSAYPKPNLPKNKIPNGTTRLSLGTFEGLELVCWDKLLDDGEANAVQDNILLGRFSVPKECPIESGTEFSGILCEPSIVREGKTWVRSSGTGILWCRSLAISGGIDRISECLAQSQGIGKAPAALLKLIELIAEQSALGETFKDGRRIGLVDRFYREENDVSFNGPLLTVVPEKPDFRSKKPMLRCSVKRHCAALDRPFTLHVSLANHDESLTDYIVEMPADVPEVTIEAASHITDVILEAFNPDGKLAQRLEGAFIQSFEFGIAALGRPDLLPKVFRGAPESADLENRPSVSTSAFSGPSIGDRSGGFDTIRRNRWSIAALVGKENWSPISLWFERGVDGQIAVIRWIKAKLEEPKTASAYLVDPFLGSEALQRVIARQGHENIALTILISPGDVDPDAESPDTKAVESHSKKLVDTANEWSDRLRGKISIVDVQRGDGQRQAFHDRYLVVIDHNGVPTAFLLSNSMSKAAGDWPFAICELDQVISHRVRAYVEDLLRGIDGERTVKPTVIWNSEQSQPVESVTQPGAAIDRPAWMAVAEAFLNKLLFAATRNSTDGHEIDETVDEFIAAWPAGMDLKALAEKLMQVVGYREQNVVRISSRLAAGTDEQRDVAFKVDELLLQKFLDDLPRASETTQSSWIHIRKRDELIRHLGQVIARKTAPTNFVRDHLNPVIEELVQAMEFQRIDTGITYVTLQIATCLIGLGLEVAGTSGAPQNYREGMAVDFIHWAGRLMRSEPAHTRFDHANTFDEFWRDDVAFCVHQISGARNALGSKVEDSINRVLADDMVLPAFKDMLRDSPTTD